MRPESVALFTPLPPAHTGTADYAAQLIPELEKLVHLHVFERVPRGFDPARYDAVIYQIANNPCHSEIYDLALRHPGIAVIHEPNLHDLIRGRLAGNPEAYAAEIYYEVFGDEFDKDRSFRSPAAQPRVFSMMRRLLENTRRCIVHSRYAESAIRLKGFSGPIGRIPHGITVKTVDGMPFRASLCIPADAPVAGMFGYLRPDKLALECLGAFAQLLTRIPAAHMIIAGEANAEVPLAETIAALGLSGKVHLAGFPGIDDLDGYISACDVILNLRHPTFGESSGIAARAFGLGRTVILSDSGAAREFPDDVCACITTGPLQARVLLETLTWLLSNPAARDEIGASAAQWAAQQCSWQRCSQLHLDFLFPVSTQSPRDIVRTVEDPEALLNYIAGWVEKDTEKEDYLREHDYRLVRTLQLTPAGGGAEDRILEMGCYLQVTPALRNLLGYSEVRGSYLGAAGTDRKAAISSDGDCFECPIDLFDCERDDFPYPDGHFATVLCCELLEHLSRDPMRMLISVHRILRPGGVLVLTTPNITSLRSLHAVHQGEHPGLYSRYPDPDGVAAHDPRHHREYTPGEVQRLLTAAGFVVEHIETGPYGREARELSTWAAALLKPLERTSRLRGDCIFAIGRRQDLPIDPRPAWLYDLRERG